MRADFTRHNEEVRRVWDAYHAGKPIRVPVGNFTIGPRIWLLNPALNTTGITMERFSTDPEVMFQVLLAYKYHLHHHVPHDIEMGNRSGTMSTSTVASMWTSCCAVRPPPSARRSGASWAAGSCTAGSSS